MKKYMVRGFRKVEYIDYFAVEIEAENEEDAETELTDNFDDLEQADLIDFDSSNLPSPEQPKIEIQVEIIEEIKN